MLTKGVQPGRLPARRARPRSESVSRVKPLNLMMPASLFSTGVGFAFGLAAGLAPPFEPLGFWPPSWPLIFPKSPKEKAGVLAVALGGVIGLCPLSNGALEFGASSHPSRRISNEHANASKPLARRASQEPQIMIINGISFNYEAVALAPRYDALRACGALTL